MIWPLRKKESERSDAWPQFDDGDMAITCWTHPNGKHRIFLISRHDGFFSTHEQFFSEEECEMRWVFNNSGGGRIFDSKETAIREIQGQFPWLNSIEPEIQT